MPIGPGERYDFFLSRRGSVAAIAREVTDVLTEKGYRVFVQDYDVPLAANFIEEMHEAIKNARDLVVLFTRDYEQSPYTRMEFTSFEANAAQSAEERRIVILRCEDAPLLGLFAPHVYQDLVGVGDAEERRSRSSSRTTTFPLPRTSSRRCIERALAINEKALGPEHPDTAASLNSLANLLAAQGELAAARPLYERALAIYESIRLVRLRDHWTGWTRTEANPGTGVRESVVAIKPTPSLRGCGRPRLGFVLLGRESGETLTCCRDLGNWSSSCSQSWSSRWEWRSLLSLCSDG